MKTVGVIGCGNMGQALIQGILAGRFASSRRIIVWDTDFRKLKRAARAFRVRAARSNAEVATSDWVLLAVKPQQMATVLEEIRPGLARRTLLISIAAGISTRWIERRVGKGIPVVRVMPNTPALVGAGVSAIAPGRAANAGHLRLAEKIFACVGQTVRVRESMMNAVTAVSGSGPAYFFFLMEQMIQAGVALGLSAETARRLVLQTATGSARLAERTGEDPRVLRARVTSKGGTTEAAFKAFAKARLDQTLRAGVRAAAVRARKLGG